MKKLKIIIDNIFNAEKYLSPGSIDTMVTSPPYWNKRNYKEAPNQLGSEKDPDEYINNMVEVGKILYKLLNSRGSYFLNISRTHYKGEVQFIPERIALKMRKQGWLIRQELIWQKNVFLPLSVTRSWNCNAYEPEIWFVKDYKNHHFFFERISEKHSEKSIKRNEKILAKMKELGVKKIFHEGSKYVKTMPRSEVPGGDQYGKLMVFDVKRGKQPSGIWKIKMTPTKVPHSAPYPLGLPDRAIKATCPKNGTAFDPFTGSGTTALAAMKHGFNFIGFEMSKYYFDSCIKRRLRWFQPRLDYKFEVLNYES